MKKHLLVLLFLTIAGSALAQGAPTVRNSMFYQQKDSEYTVYYGNINLPAHGLWKISDTLASEDVVQLYMEPPENADYILSGQRMKTIKKNQFIQESRYFLRNIYWPCKEYAADHKSTGPSSLSDLDSEDMLSIFAYWNKENIYKKIEGPFVFLLPNVRFIFKEDEKESKHVEEKNRLPLAVELRPYVNDGKHWVVYTDGSTHREPVDSKLVKKYNLNIRPVLSKKDDLPSEISYTILALRKKNVSGPFAVSVKNTLSNDVLNVRWDTATKTADKKTVTDALKKARRKTWAPYYRSSYSPVLYTWLDSYSDRKKAGSSNTRGNTRQNLSVFGLLGGRTAVRETLQMQLLNVRDDKEQEQTIPVDTIKGVDVTSHPFKKMLNGKTGGRLALADTVPHDRFFVYVAKPSAIMPFLDDGTKFLSSLGSVITSSKIEYNLKTKYLNRLGLDEQLLRMLLKSGAVMETGLIFPDLFFIDGTEITAVSRIKQPQLLATFLEMAGVKQLFDKNIISLKLKNGQNVFWALQDDLLFTSTSKSEIDASLALLENAGKGSLGQSDEFRYMLTQLPVTKNTRIYGYLSDPFIRKLVGPLTKIGQLRRVKTHADMEYLTSCALLAKLDGISNPESVKKLAQLEYILPGYLNKGYSIDKNLVVHSETCGTLGSMKTLSEVPVDKVTKQEEDAYKAYVENYQKYWSRYFDPIAVRLDDQPDGSLEATTFILPLIDNSIYNHIRDILSKQEDGITLRIPELSPKPVMMLSLNLTEDSWIEIAKDMADVFEQYTTVSSSILDDLGPGLHLAVHDADPVIALGSGDILGAFNGMRYGAGNDLLGVPVVLSVLTRPCTLIVETREPEKARQILRQASKADIRKYRLSFFDPEYEFYQIDGKDEWVFLIDIMGTIKLRYGIEVQKNFIMIRNIPWSNTDRIVNVEEAVLNGARLNAFPGSCDLQLPGLNTSASESNRKAGLRGTGLLYPLAASGFATIDNISEKHSRLFGFKPVHPGNGQWRWENNHLESTVYGSVFRQKQPGPDSKSRKLGLLKDIEYLGVSMQFEDTGLRTILKWKK